MSRETRREQLRELMERQGLGAILLQRPANFAWYTSGADNRVDHADPLGVAAILVTTKSEYVVCDNIEAPRMREEETPEFEVLEHPWYGDPSGIIDEASGGALGVDHYLEGSEDVSRDVAPMRYVLDEEAIDRYRRVAARTPRGRCRQRSVISPGTSSPSVRWRRTWQRPVANRDYLPRC